MANVTKRHTDASYDDLMEKLSLDSTTSEPYYLQLKRKIKGLIETGELGSGLGLPAERVLAAMLNVSRTTVKRCYDELRKSGELSTHGRGGTLVKDTPRVSPTLGKLRGFTEEMAEVGVIASTRVLQHDIIQDRTIASIFKRPSTATFLRMVRLRLGDGVPMTREIAWYDLTSAPQMADWDTSGSAYIFLQDRCNIKMTWAEQSIEAIMSSPEESEIFGFSESNPCLLLKRKSFSTQDQLVEYIEGTFRGDAYAYRLKLSV
jgi:GntR family transcriptional regulator